MSHIDTGCELWSKTNTTEADMDLTGNCSSPYAQVHLPEAG